MVRPEQSSAPPSLRPSGLAGVDWPELLATIGLTAGPIARRSVPDLRVTGVTADSRLVQPGDLYVAVPGARAHGADFSAEAVDRGACAVLTDPAGEERALDAAAAADAVPVGIVPGPRALIPTLADRIYHHPAARLQLFGITGTNGKTTTAYLLQAALRATGRHVGLIGTIGYQLDERPLESRRTTVTTPEAAELYALLAVMAEQGAEAVVMEVSSHALALGRVDGLVFDVAAFTNFGSDHLDFHGDVASYFAAKASLFTATRARRAVINTDDPRGAELVNRARAEGLDPVRSVSLDGPGDYRTTARTPSGQGRTAVTAATPGGPLDVTLGLPGEFNIRNALTALAMADLALSDLPPTDSTLTNSTLTDSILTDSTLIDSTSTDLTRADLRRATDGLADAVVPGRMQRVELGPGAPTVFVDFAHTPQAVTAVLATLAGHRRVVVLGCGGDRDPEKRAPMGAAAVVGAELVVVTDDNPRTEDPVAIRAQVLAGARAEVERTGRDVVIRDGGRRRDAIAAALAASGPEDVVAVLGKGHERGQEIAGQVLPFADEDAVREVWAELRHPELSDAVVARTTTAPDDTEMDNTEMTEQVAGPPAGNGDAP